MTYALSFIAGIFIGGLIGVFMMCCLTAAGQADEREERMHGQNHGSDL